MYYLCDLKRGESVARAYLNEKDAQIGRIVKLEVNGLIQKGFKVECIGQTIEDAYVEDNKLINKAIPWSGFDF